VTTLEGYLISEGHKIRCCNSHQIESLEGLASTSFAFSVVVVLWIANVLADRISSVIPDRLSETKVKFIDKLTERRGRLFIYSFIFSLLVATSGDDE
jgi:MFS family permease